MTKNDARLRAHLSIAEQHIVEGERLITMQRSQMADREQSPMHRAAAEALLISLNELHRFYVADRDRLLDELKSK